jgi:hypothetical protein
MPFTASVPFDGDARKALDLARAALAGSGFAVDPIDDASLTAHRRDNPLMGKRAPALLGAGEVRLEARAGQLQLDADYGGVRAIALFLAVFIPGLCAVLSLTFGALAFAGAMPAVASAGVWLFLVPWLVLGPLLVWLQKRRTDVALRTLLENAAAAGRS